MTNLIIRETEDTTEVESFALWSDENEGDEVYVAELNGKVVGFVQFSGNYLYFVESDVSGIGRALVDWHRDGRDYVRACNVSPAVASFWMKMGFEKGVATGERPGEYHYEWYSEEE